jgi:hypothetical protein
MTPDLSSLDRGSSAKQHYRQEMSMDRATSQAWRELQFHWDSAYIFSHKSRFTATRRDIGTVLTADSPEELADLIQTDYRANKVSRNEFP